MKIFVNSDTRTLHTSLAGKAITQIDVKRGDVLDLDLAFFSAGLVGSVDAGSAIVFGAKENRQFEAPLVAYSGTFVAFGSGSGIEYRGSVSFNNSAINSILGVGGHVRDVRNYIDLMGEISWTNASGARSTVTFLIRVHNDVVRGDEGAPDPAAPGAQEWLSAAISPLELSSPPTDEIPGAIHQRAIVTTVIDGVTFKDLWWVSSTEPMAWEPPGNIFKSLSGSDLGTYYRQIFRDGSPDYIEAYPSE